jgi:hypothetical protein
MNASSVTLTSKSEFYKVICRHAELIGWVAVLYSYMLQLHIIKSTSAQAVFLHYYMFQHFFLRQTIRYINMKVQTLSSTWNLRGSDDGI